VVAIALQDRTRLVDQRRQGMAGGGLRKRDPGVAAGGVVGLGGVVQPVAVGLGETGLLGCGGPFALLAVGGEGAGLGAKVRVGPRGQELDEARRRRGIGAVRQGGRHFGQPLDDRHRFRLGRRRAIHEAREIRRGLPERRQVAVKRRDGPGRERGAAAQILGDLVDQRHGLAGAVQHHLGQDAALAAGQAFAQPAIDNLEEGEIGLVAIHDAGAGVDVGSAG
jgi:hypothetical protein